METTEEPDDGDERMSQQNGQNNYKAFRRAHPHTHTNTH